MSIALTKLLSTYNYGRGNFKITAYSPKSIFVIIYFYLTQIPLADLSVVVRELFQLKRKSLNHEAWIFFKCQNNARECHLLNYLKKKCNQIKLRTDAIDCCDNKDVPLQQSHFNASSADAIKFYKMLMEVKLKTKL